MLNINTSRYSYGCNIPLTAYSKSQLTPFAATAGLFSVLPYAICIDKCKLNT